MKKMQLLAAGVLSVVSVTASAQAVKSGQGFYVGLEGGAAHYDLDVERSPGTIEKNDAGMFRFGGGYQFTPNFSVEMGYFRIGATSVEKTDHFSRDSAKARVSGFDLTASYKFSNVLPGLYFKGGITQAKLTEDAHYEYRDLGFSGSVSERASKSGTGYLLGLGYEYDLSEIVSINGGYTRYEDLAGHSNADVNFFAAGLKYRF
ncbi:porin family protein [Herbaspirillum sp. AP02]|uniref:porin family protein n=1 Tax=unclassified Herbaspirillum TaxID=2624150 RepID=UPI0015D96F43|nr:MULTISPECIES: porin family protein [unclassified Herbaspirillum]MBG7620554.1 porin family protein [Herbaspirillum sp. AP02]NZD68018.1 porin family protein [Herbaspirillum sp. AP21]